MCVSEGRAVIAAARSTSADWENWNSHFIREETNRRELGGEAEQAKIKGSSVWRLGCVLPDNTCNLK